MGLIGQPRARAAAPRAAWEMSAEDVELGCKTVNSIRIGG